MVRNQHLGIAKILALNHETTISDVRAMKDVENRKRITLLPLL
jgi:hypothetical protein